MTRTLNPVLLSFLAAACVSACSQDPVSELPALGAVRSETSVSGISSGAYMAGQFQLAHASDVVGAAIIAGGPYGCAESAFSGMVIGPAATMLNASKAVAGCMLNTMAVWGVPDPVSLAAKAKDRAERGEIGPLADAITDKVYLFSGSEDRTVLPGIVASAAEFYRALGVPQANIKFVSNLPAGHAFVTETAGGACDMSSEPYVVDCDYDQARDLLSHIYGPLKPPSATPAGRFVTFTQTPFDPEGDADLAPSGAAYIPDACRAGGCRVHIAFHGCQQSRELVGDAFVKGAGFARWADTNRLVVLFPQVSKSSGNPQGCWDWWGYTGRDFLKRDAPQTAAVHRMLERLSLPSGGA